MARGDARRRRNGFKKGNNLTPTKHATQVVDPVENLPVQYLRVTAREAEFMAQEPILKGAIEKRRIVSDPQPNVKLLRSHTKTSGSERASMDPKQNNYSANSECYKLLHTRKLWEMVNAVTRKHLHMNPSCDGDLQFDPDCEEQRGLCRRQCAICSRCMYRSKMYNLYEEIETGKPGRKYATANIGLNIALTQTPAGPTSFRKMCLASNIPAPSRSGMQKCAANVCKYIKAANMEDMNIRQNELKRINKFKGRPEQEVSVQADGMYNNNLYSGVGKTPFQPTTQAVYIVAENMTEQHQIIACVTPNKICAKHGFHSKDDQKPCDSKHGPCTATIPIEQNIGDEKTWAREALTDLKSNGLEVNYITTDPDTAAHRAALELYQDNVTNTLPEMQIDTRHLSECHRKLIKSDARVEKMMPGSTKAYRQYLQNRFALDLSKRCQAEFNTIHRQENGDFCRLSTRMHQCINAIKHCYAGNHSRCIIHSSVCCGFGSDNWRLQNNYLPKSFKISISNGANECTLLDCIEYRLGDLTLQQTKLNTNTQKVEATNRSLCRSLPKNVTYTRNFTGRAQSAVHSVNNGPGNSIFHLCEKLRCPIPHKGRVDTTLRSLQRQSEIHKNIQKMGDRKIKRKMRRIIMYQLYERQREEKNYKRYQLLNSIWSARITGKHSETITLHNTCAENQDHTYERVQKSRRGSRQAGVCARVQ